MYTDTDHNTARWSDGEYRSRVDLGYGCRVGDVPLIPQRYGWHRYSYPYRITYAVQYVGS